MCGRFSMHHTWAELHRLYSLSDADTGRNDVEARYNIAPKQNVFFITADEGGVRKVRNGMWWLVPHWAKEVSKYPTFNARSEDAETKSSFRQPMKSKRCLIPASGFFEWKDKQPYHIVLPGQPPFSFAGLWDYNKTLDITSCTILTEAAGPAMAPLHTRQPIILDPAYYSQWLNPSTSTEDAKKLLEHDLDDQLEYYPVDKKVGAVVTTDKRRNDDPSMIAPIAP